MNYLKQMQTKLSKKRASVEYNGMELVSSLIILFPDINNYDELLNKIVEIIKNKVHYESIIKFNKYEDFGNYVNDIGKKTIIVNDFINNLRDSIKTFEEFKPDNIKCIFISGKTNKHKEIQDLNIDVNKLEAKGDIYVKFNNDEIVGISIKQSKQATKSNYSVQKMLGSEENIILTNVKKQYLNENGITQFDKNQREIVNALFYPQNKNNIYWNSLREMIDNKKYEISKKLAEPLFCSNVKYVMYEYDGIHFVKLNKNLDSSAISFEEHLPYYFDKKGNERKTAKLFYRLIIDQKIYRVEIRWKGNVYDASPQFQIHEEDEYKEDKEDLNVL
jgi:hypothetical protein